MSDSLQSHGLPALQAPCPSLSPRVWLNSYPLSRWYYLTISSSAALIFFCLQSFPASESFPMSWLFASGGQSIRASASVLPMSIQSWFPLGSTGLISLLSKGLSRVPKILLCVCMHAKSLQSCPALCIRWSKYWRISISPSSEYSGLVSFRSDWFDLLAVQGTLESSAAHS